MLLQGPLSDSVEDNLLFHPKKKFTTALLERRLSRKGP